MKFRKLRIAWSVVCGIACVLLVVLWVRSLFRFDAVEGSVGNRLYGIQSYDGDLRFGVFVYPQRIDWTWTVGAIGLQDDVFGYGPPTVSDPTTKSVPNIWKSRTRTVFFAPTWFFVLVSLALLSIPWLPYRFSLRTLLIATTLIALVLGLIVAVIRWPAG